MDDLILISFLLIHDWVSDHLSFISKRSANCSWINMYGLMVMSSGGHSFWTKWMRRPLLGLALLKVDADIENEPWICQYASSLLKKMTVYQHPTTGNTWSTSCLFLSDLDVPLGHSWIPYTTTLYLWSGNGTLVEAALFCLWIDSYTDGFWWVGGSVRYSVYS